LGKLRYMHLISHADLVIGNSSSGIIEAPLVSTPSVNIGARQKGRQRQPSVIDSGVTEVEIRNAINIGLRRGRELTPSTSSHKRLPSDVIVETLCTADPKAILAKPFVDHELCR